MANPEAQVYKPKEVAARLDMDVATVWSLIRRGVLPVKNVSGGKRPTYRIPREQFERWLAGGKSK
jgi:excisionase family DNA binding protein